MPVKEKRKMKRHWCAIVSLCFAAFPAIAQTPASISRMDNSSDQSKDVIDSFFSKQNLQTTSNFSRVDAAQLAGSSLYQDNALVDLPPLPSLDDKAAHKEALRLIGLLRNHIPHYTLYTPEKRKRWIALARQETKKAGIKINRPQILVVVDRNPKVQALCLILAFPQGHSPWMVLGGDRVSTGKKGRKLYYITPTGVFINSTERLGYRAQGTKNKYGIRGNGIKGMRVWDFGWQWAEKGWLPNHEKGQIRLEMHATDPDYLEARLGHTASEGCVRISAAMNRFIDQHGLIDALYLQAATKDKRFRSVLSKQQEPSLIAGDALVVVDSSDMNVERQS